MSLPRKPLNPGYMPPKDYMPLGLTEGPERACKPELVGERAAGLGRQFLIEQIPLEAVAQALQELEVIARLQNDVAGARARLSELASRSATTRYPLLAQVLTVGASHVRRIEDLRALALHLKRAHMLAALSRVLMGATAAERERTERRKSVRGQRPKA